MSDPNPKIELSVNGKAFEGFAGGSVSSSMEEPVNSFELYYVAEGKQPGKRAIFCGDECKLSIDAGSGSMETLVEGYIVSTSDEDVSDGIRLSCSGKSKAVDLYDCSAINKPGRWTKQGLAAIAKDIASPFGVSVVVDGSAGGSFDEFSIVKGETAYDAIQRAALKRGMYVFSVGKDLVIAKAGSKSSGATLERGKGVVIRSSRNDSWESRHSEYIYRGQVRGKDNASGKSASQLKSSVKDATINRYRPLLLQSEAGNADELKARAQLERNQRAGRGEVVTVTTEGWGTPKGKLWRANTTVTFKNDVLGVDATFLIVSARYEFGPNEPRKVDLTLMRPEAFDVKDYPKTKRGASTADPKFGSGAV